LKISFQKLITHIEPKWSKEVYEWGKSGNLDEMTLEWYVPTQREIEAANLLLKKYLQPNLDALMR
jgi:hypothetical protein